MTPQSHRFAAGPVTLAVHDWGGDGPPTLLAHPTGFHGRVWAPVAERLVAHHRRVWSFDYRGHGDSDAPDEDYSWHNFASDVRAVAQHLGVDGAPALVACGHSKGAASLLIAEAKHPGTFPRIWAYEPIVFPTETSMAPDHDFPLAGAARKRRNEWESPQAAYESYASKPPMNVMTEESLRAYTDYAFRDRGDGVYELKCAPEIEARVYAMGPNHGAWNLLPDVQAQVVVVCGELSNDIGARFGQRIVERLPHGRLEVFAGAGHFGPQQDPDATVASILQFARE